MRRKRLLSLLVLLIVAVTGTRAKLIDISTIPDDHIMAQNGDVLTGTMNQAKTIMIAPGATVTLNGVNINGNGSLSDEFAGIECNGSATIVLKAGTTNIVRGLAGFCPGIRVHSNIDGTVPTLTVKGDGRLEAYCGETRDEGYVMKIAAGIGGDSDNPCGNIILQSGTIIAEGGGSQPGIGSTAGCGNVTVGGDAKLTVIKGEEATAYIGTDDKGTECGMITFESSINESAGGVLTVHPVYDITFADGTVDVTNWLVSENPAYEDQTVVLYYKGKKKVKAIILETAPDPVLVTGITMSKTETELTEGETETLSVTVVPEDATDKTYTWSSESNDIATVDNNGKVTAIKEGTVTIYATANDNSGVAAECTVTVKAAAVTKTYTITADADTYGKKELTVDELPYETTIQGLLAELGASSIVSEVNACKLKSGDGSLEVGDFNTTTQDCTLKAVKAGTSIVTISAKISMGSFSSPITADVTITVAEK